MLYFYIDRGSIVKMMRTEKLRVLFPGRNGPTGTVRASFINKYAKFENYSEDQVHSNTKPYC